MVARGIKVTPRGTFVICRSQIKRNGNGTFSRVRTLYSSARLKWHAQRNAPHIPDRFLNVTPFRRIRSRRCWCCMLENGELSCQRSFAKQSTRFHLLHGIFVTTLSIPHVNRGNFSLRVAIAKPCAGRHRAGYSALYLALLSCTVMIFTVLRSLSKCHSNSDRCNATPR